VAKITLKVKYLWKWRAVTNDITEDMIGFIATLSQGRSKHFDSLTICSILSIYLNVLNGMLPHRTFPILRVLPERSEYDDTGRNEVSSWYPEKQHSMFTYFFLTAITGSADFNQDKKITYQEIYDFDADRAEGVPYYAKRLHGGRIQNPTMQAADKDAVFVKY